MALEVQGVCSVNSREKKAMPPTPVQRYSQVKLTLENILLPPEKLATSPSKDDGLDEDIELDLRIKGCELIQTSGILLKLPQVVMATGQVLFQRFYSLKSLVRYPMKQTAMACIALASKIEESPRSIQDIINVFTHIKQIANGDVFQPVILDSTFINQKNQIIAAERKLLATLGFCCQVKHPHKIIIMYLRLLELDEKKMLQTSWNYMNDVLRTDALLRYTPEAIACACIWLSGRILKICLPENPPWYHIFNVNIEDIEEIAASILKLYKRQKVKLEVLEARVNEVSKKLQKARMKNAAASLPVSPKETSSFSPPATKNIVPSAPKHNSSAERCGTKPSGSSRHSSSSSDKRCSSSRQARKRRSYSSRRHSRSRSRSLGRHRSKKRHLEAYPQTVDSFPKYSENKINDSSDPYLARSHRVHRRNYDNYNKTRADPYEKTRSDKPMTQCRENSKKFQSRRCRYYYNYDYRHNIVFKGK